MIEQYDKSLILHSNFSFSRDHQFCRMPPFYLEIVQIWSEATSQTPASVEQMLSQSLWFHNSILIDKKPVYFLRMSKCGFNKVKDLVIKVINHLLKREFRRWKLHLMSILNISNYDTLFPTLGSLKLETQVLCTLKSQSHVFSLFVTNNTHWNN